MVRWTCLLCLLAVGTALGQPAADVKELSVSASAPPRPALRYRLLPPVTELKSGNAAVHYLRAMGGELLRSWEDSPLYKQSTEFLKGPPDKITRADLNSFRGALAEIHRGGLVSSCDYEYSMERMRNEGFALLLPDLQKHRGLAALVALKARCHLGEKKFDEAAGALQSGLAMSRHVNQGPTLIHALVAAAIAGQMLNQVDEWIQTPDSPNLYWALTALPSPMLDCTKAYQAETAWLDWLLPEHRDLDKVVFRDADVEAMIQRALEKAKAGGGEIKLDLDVDKRFDAARKYLLANGRTEEQLKPLCKGQVVIMHEINYYFSATDDTNKSLHLPYWEAMPQLKRVEESIQKDMILTSQLLPATNRVLTAMKRVDRRIAMLRTAEAVRAYVAATGKVPANLEELDVRSVKSDCPAALDPMTGKPFQFKVEKGSVVRLTGVPLEGEAPSPANSIEYVLEFKKLQK